MKKFRIWDGERMSLPFTFTDIRNSTTDDVISSSYIRQHFPNEEHSYDFTLHDDNIERFTGLFDMDGLEIYEGDILMNVQYDFMFKVQWGMMGESYAGWAGNWTDRDFISPLYNGPLVNCRIVGNIHESEEIVDKRVINNRKSRLENLE
jgi:hypothetical protein